MLTGLPPAVSPRTRLLILGSFPGRASLDAGQYYAHPRNQLWPILGQILGVNLPAMPYGDRLLALDATGFGLWDVYAACEREGSLDTKIRTPVPNDFEILRTLAPNLRHIGHNGAESFRHASRCPDLGLPTCRLPSTSPANASWSFERKVSAWRAWADACTTVGRAR